MRLKMCGESPKRGVAVDKVSVAIDKERPIRVSVKSDAEVGALLRLLFPAAIRCEVSRSRG